MDAIALRTSLAPFATWLYAHTAGVAARAGASIGAPLYVHPPFQGPGPEGGVPNAECERRKAESCTRHGQSRSPLRTSQFALPTSAGPPLVLPIAAAPVPDSLRLQCLTDTAAPRALWTALLAAFPAAWWTAPLAAHLQGGVIRRP